MSKRGAYIEEVDGTLTKIKGLNDEVRDIDPKTVKGKLPIQQLADFTSLWDDRACTIPTTFGDPTPRYEPTIIFIRNDSQYELKNFKYLFFRGKEFSRALRAEGPDSLYPGEVGKITIEIGDIDEFPLDAIEAVIVGGEDYVMYKMEKLNITLNTSCTIMIR